MPGLFLRLNAVTRDERIRMTGVAREAITSADGWITDFHLFSNVSICINFEIPAARVGRLRDALAATRLRLSEESAAALAEFDADSARGASAEPTAAEEEVSGTLQITFVHDEPDLRREVPHIPG